MDVPYGKVCIIIKIFHHYLMYICDLTLNTHVPTRLFVRLKALVRNRAYPEGSIAEGYIADECLTFCSRFLDGTTRFTRPSRNPEPSDEAKQAYLFHSAGEPIGKVVNVNQFDNQLLVQAHRYVLRHCDELEGFRRCVNIYRYRVLLLLLFFLQLNECTN